MFTLDVSVALMTWQTGAGDAVVGWNTLCVISTGVLCARVDTDTVESVAKLVRWTVFVVLTDRSTRVSHCTHKKPFLFTQFNFKGILGTGSYLSIYLI